MLAAFVAALAVWKEQYFEGRTMKIGTVIRWAARRVLPAAALSAALVATIAAPASASVVDPGYVKLCNGSNYAARMQFDDRGGAWAMVLPGQCYKTENMSAYLGTEKVQFRGYWNPSFNITFPIRTVYIDLDLSGVGVTVKGTTDHPSSTVW
jgi:hypothetical protein